MKTKELIKLLQEIDPTGETDVVVGNAPIFYVDCLPGYYDSCYRKLTLDENGHIIGFEVVSSGNKIDLRCMDYDMILLDDPDMPCKYDEHSEARYRKIIDDERQKMKDMRLKSEVDHFIKYYTKKYGVEGVSAASVWAYKNLDYKLKIPADILALRNPHVEDEKVVYGLSFNEMRELQWDREVKLSDICGNVVEVDNIHFLKLDDSSL